MNPRWLIKAPVHLYLWTKAAPLIVFGLWAVSDYALGETILERAGASFLQRANDKTVVVEGRDAYLLPAPKGAGTTYLFLEEGDLVCTHRHASASEVHSQPRKPRLRPLGCYPSSRHSGSVD